MKKWLVLAACTLIIAVCVSEPAQGLALKMQPLIYKDTLKKGEKKKGFVDISNPTATTLQLQTSVQAFRQIDDNGSLQFYDDPQISAGITPDFSEFELGPRQAVRMYFLIDGTKLPSGDVYAALFASTKPVKQTGAASSLRVGTLLALTNGTPGTRDAEITDISVPFWQFGDTIQGSYRIKNVAKPDSATGFFPTVLVSLDPLHHAQEASSKLVFAGRSRENEFQISHSRIGLYKISVSYGGSSRDTWVLVATWYWTAVIFAIAALVVLGIVGLRKFSSRKRALTSEK